MSTSTSSSTSTKHLVSRKGKRHVETTEEIEENLDKSFYDAVLKNQTDMVLNLLEKEKADINWKNKEDENKTPLHIATQNGNLVLLALLVGKGADVTARDDSGRTPLHIALETKNEEVIEFLVTKVLASLEESSHQIKKAWNLNENNIKSYMMLQEARRMYRASPDASQFNTAAVSREMNKIFDTPTRQSIFQTHVARESPITEMLRISHFQTIYNIFVSVFLIALVNTLIHNYYDNGTVLDLQIFIWCFSGLPTAFLFWICLIAFSFIVVVLQKSIVLKILEPKIAHIIYVCAQLLIFFGVPKVVSYFAWGPASGAFIMGETVRLCMKMHSYIMVNYMLRIAKECNDADPAVKEYPGNVTFWDFLRFLCFPTLVYQTSYPRTQHIRKGFVLARFAEVCLCIIYIYAIMIRYIHPHSAELVGDYKSLTLGIFKVMLPGIGISLLGFFMVLHSWLNAWAEITQFADRHFYSDWWNVTSWAVYYRKWNFVVHNFIHRHVFTELVLLHYSKQTAMWMTFFISAIIHEYVIAVSLGFYKPILLLMFLIPGVLFIYLTKMFGRGSRAWNIFMWSMLIVGHGCLFGLYFRAWYHYYNGLVKPPQTFGEVLLSLINIF